MSAPQDEDRATFLVSLPIRTLAAHIASGSCTAVEALHAFRSRAKRANAALNAVTEWLEDADANARELDEELRRTGRTRGPLHGVPFTLKDHFHMAGTLLTMGDRSMAGYRSKAGMDAAVAAALVDAGGVCFAKTNMSEHGETWASSNPVFGTTRNPWDPARTSGGSSSGEGALVGCAATAFGVGSDVGGSVRIPAAFNGHVALKPTADRAGFSLAAGKLLLNFPGEYGVPAAAGPMARRVDDVAVVMAVLSGTNGLHRYHPRVPPVPFDEAAYRSTRPLRIGFFTGCADPAPDAAAQRALRESVDALRKLGHTVREFVAPGVASWPKVFELYMLLQFAKASPGALTGVTEPEAEPKEKMRHGQPPQKHHPEWLAQAAASAKFVRSLGGAPAPGSPPQYFALVARRDKLRDAFFQAMRDQGFDVLLSPTLSVPAPRIASVVPLMRAATGHEAIMPTLLQNVLDAPCGVVPVSTYTEPDVRAIRAQVAGSHSGLAKLVAQEAAVGLPVTLSVTGPPWCEELVLNGMRQVERASAWDVASNVQRLAKL